MADTESNIQSETDKNIWRPDTDLIVRTIQNNFTNDPGTLFTCSLVCIPWCEIAIELIENVPPSVWKEKAQLKYPWAVEGINSPKGGWGEWMKSFRTHFNDKKEGWIQLKTKGTWKLLWMNTQSTGLMLYREYRENRFCFINLERGLEIKKVEKKGKQFCSTISTLEHNYTFSCVRELDREGWIEATQEIIQFYNPRHKEMVTQLKNNEVEGVGMERTISKLMGQKLFKKIGTGFRSTKLYGNVPVVDNVEEEQKKEQPPPTSPKRSKPSISLPKDLRRPSKKIPEKIQKYAKSHSKPEVEAIPVEEKITEEEPEQETEVPETNEEEISKDLSFSIDSVITDDSKKEDINYKVIIIGNSGVGKSNLLERWLKNKFSTTNVTLSTDLVTKSFFVDGKHIKVSFWDTAGQEAHFSITQSYFRQSHGAIVVYDITIADTFFDIQKWVTAVKDIPGNENTQFLLIGNKLDLESKREVATKMGLQFAKKLGLNFMETSALSGSNVNRAFQIILQDIHKIAKSLQLESTPNTPLNVGKTVAIQNGDQPQNQCCGFL